MEPRFTLTGRQPRQGLPRRLELNVSDSREQGCLALAKMDTARKRQSTHGSQSLGRIVLDASPIWWTFGKQRL